MAPRLTLVQVDPRRSATVTDVEWSALSVPEARRLRELGLDDGVDVEVLHRARLGGGPIACRVGRMTVAMRRSVAQQITVTAYSEAAE